MRLSFRDLANICVSICAQETYRVDVSRPDVQVWENTNEGVPLRVTFSNRGDRWRISSGEVGVAFTYKTVQGEGPKPSHVPEAVQFGISWGRVENCVYWGNADKVKDAFTLLKLFVPVRYDYEHTYAEFESNAHPDAG
jgi:hypothetical protein